MDQYTHNYINTDDRIVKYGDNKSLFYFVVFIILFDIVIYLILYLLYLVYYHWYEFSII